MSSRATKMFMIYGRYGVELRFDYAHEWAVGFPVEVKFSSLC